MEGLKGNAMISTPCKILSFIQQKKKNETLTFAFYSA